MNAPLRTPDAVAHDIAPELEQDIGRIVARAAKRAEISLLISDARAAIRRLNEIGIYHSECRAFEEDAQAKVMDAIEAFHARHIR